MKILLGIVIGAGIMIGGTVFAQGSGMFVVNTLKTEGSWSPIEKIYDADNNVVCYFYSGGSTGSTISCLKNN